MTIEKQIQALNWHLEQSRTPCQPQLFWASQNGFVTPRRETMEMVLKDLQELQAADNFGKHKPNTETRKEKQR